MATEIFFTERQRFKIWWVWGILITVICLLLYRIITEASDRTELIWIVLLVVLIAGLILSLRLDTKVSKAGIYYRFWPFQREYRNASWDSIDKSYVRKYNPIMEYGGWGMRTSFSGEGKAYNIAGNHGLQLVYNNGKKLLLGTQKPEEMKDVLRQLGKLSNEKLS